MPLDVGFGPTTPLRRNRANDFTAAGGRALLNSRVGQILGTRRSTATSTGEVPWRPTFGSRLHLLRHQNDTVVRRALARAWVEEALAEWEPSVQVTGVVVEPVLGQPTQLRVSVTYTVLASSGDASGDEAEAEVVL